MNVTIPEVDALALAWASRGSILMSIGSVMVTMTPDEARSLSDDLLLAVAEHEARAA